MEKWESYTEEEIKDFLKKSKTKKQFAEFLGYVKISSKTWDKLKIAYPEINFDIFKTGYNINILTMRNKVVNNIIVCFFSFMLKNHLTNIYGSIKIKNSQLLTIFHY